MSFVSLQRPKSKYPNEWIVCCGPQSPNEFRYIFAVEEEAEAEDKGEDGEEERQFGRGWKS